MPSFTKMREIFLLENPLQNSWLSEALTPMECHKVAKLNARLLIRQRADLYEANILANKISLP